VAKVDVAMRPGALAAGSVSLLLGSPGGCSSWDRHPGRVAAIGHGRSPAAVPAPEWQPHVGGRRRRGLLLPGRRAAGPGV